MGSRSTSWIKGQLEVESRLGAAGDRLAELQEHGQLALADRVADGPAQGDGQDQQEPDQDGKPSGAVHLPRSPFAVQVQERQELLEIGVDDGLVLHALEQILHGLEVEPLPGDLGGTLVGVILGQEGLDLALGLGPRREA